MKITQVSMGKIINTGNYESTRIDLTARVNEDESWQEVMENVENELLRMEKKIKKDGTAV